jgi:uncharacterized metal-binding protein
LPLPTNIFIDNIVGLARPVSWAAGQLIYATNRKIDLIGTKERLNMSSEQRPKTAVCASCDIEMEQRICRNESGKPGKGCPTLTAKELLAEANQEYQKPQVGEFARQASIQESEGYTESPVPHTLKPRIQEICEFAQKMAYRRLGIAFCMGLAQETAQVEKILEAYGFEVFSVACKAGGTSKDLIHAKYGDKLAKGVAKTMCNPIFQAKLLNSLETDFNILIGLCVGHDSLFIRYSEAPLTVLAVKDRVTGHNPLAALYTSGSYYRRILKPQD